MLDPQLDDMGLQRRAVGPRLAEQGVAESGQRPTRICERTGITSRPELRRIAAIYRPIVVHIFVGQQNPVVAVQLRAEGRVDRETPAIIEIAMVVEFFVEPVDPERRHIADRQVEVSGEIIGSEAVHARGGLAKLAICDRGLGHPVDDPAAAAAAKDHRIGPLVDLDPLDIVERSEILDVIADAIDEEIGGAILPPYRDLIAVAFTLPDGCAGRVPENIPDILKRLIIKLFPGHDRHRLRRIQERGIGFQAGAADRDIAFLFPRHDDFLIISHAVVPGLLGGCLYRTCSKGDQTDRRKNAQRTARNNIHRRTPLDENYSRWRVC